MQENRKHIVEELSEISLVVANLPKNNVYTIQPDYFNNLANEILQNIHQTELLTKAKTNTYIAPNGYFTNFADNLLIKIKNKVFENEVIKDELITVAPTLNSISKSNVFAIPENYFATSKVAIPSRLNATKKTSIFLHQWFKYSVAAIVIGIIAVSLIQFLKTNNSSVNLEKEIAKTSNEEIVSYLTNNTHTDFVTSNIVLDEHETLGLFEKASTDEIKTYLNQQPEMVENTH